MPIARHGYSALHRPTRPVRFGCAVISGPLLPEVYGVHLLVDRRCTLYTSQEEIPDTWTKEPAVPKNSRAHQREPLNRDRVLRAGVRLADEAGIEAVSMRRLAQQPDVEPMAVCRPAPANG